MCMQEGSRRDEKAWVEFGVLNSGVGGGCRKCEGHDDAVRVLAVAGGKVFSGSYDGSIGVW